MSGVTYTYAWSYSYDGIQFISSAGGQTAYLDMPSLGGRLFVRVEVIGSNGFHAVQSANVIASYNFPGQQQTCDIQVYVQTVFETSIDMVVDQYGSLVGLNLVGSVDILEFYSITGQLLNRVELEQRSRSGTSKKFITRELLGVQTGTAVVVAKSTTTGGRAYAVMGKL